MQQGPRVQFKAGITQQSPISTSHEEQQLVGVCRSQSVPTGAPNGMRSSGLHNRSHLRS
jgi:hypothetical protein